MARSGGARCWRRMWGQGMRLRRGYRRDSCDSSGGTAFDMVEFLALSLYSCLFLKNT